MSDSLQEFADNCGPDVEGTVYLIHFNEPVGNKSNPRGQARHYMGWTCDLKRRLAEHAGGNGARLMEVVSERGITWRLVRIWTGPQSLERRLKRQHNGPRLCPVCRGEP